MSESHASALALLTAEHTSLAQQLQSQQSQFNTLQQSFNQLSLEQSEVISQREALTEQLRLCELKIQQIGNENNFAQQGFIIAFPSHFSVMFY
jgi:chromosome segregation ATPase